MNKSGFRYEQDSITMIPHGAFRAIIKGISGKYHKQKQQRQQATSIIIIISHHVYSAIMFLFFVAQSGTLIRNVRGEWKKWGKGKPVVWLLIFPHKFSLDGCCFPYDFHTHKKSVSSATELNNYSLIINPPFVCWKLFFDLWFFNKLHRFIARKRFAFFLFFFFAAVENPIFNGKGSFFFVWRHRRNLYRTLLNEAICQANDPKADNKLMSFHDLRQDCFGNATRKTKKKTAREMTNQSAEIFVKQHVLEWR